MVIANDILQSWRNKDKEEELSEIIADRWLAEAQAEENKKSPKRRETIKPLREDEKYWHYLPHAYKAKKVVRNHPLTHTVIFFIDHNSAPPHQADIHVLLRTCLHPAHGVNTILNLRSAKEWADTLEPKHP